MCSDLLNCLLFIYNYKVAIIMDMPTVNKVVNSACFKGYFLQMQKVRWVNLLHSWHQLKYTNVQHFTYTDDKCTDEVSRDSHFIVTI